MDPEQQPQKFEANGHVAEDADFVKGQTRSDDSNSDSNLTAAEEGKKPQEPVIHEHAIYEGRKLPDDHMLAFSFTNFTWVCGARCTCHTSGYVLTGPCLH